MCACVAVMYRASLRHSLLQDGLAGVRVGSGAEIVDDDALRARVVQVTAALKELVLVRDSAVLEVKPGRRSLLALGNGKSRRKVFFIFNHFLISIKTYVTL